MEDERWESGMPVLDRPGRRRNGGAAGARSHRTGPVVPSLPPSLQGLPPRSVPETEPTPLQRHTSCCRCPVLILGAIAITSLEVGVPLGSR
jgi:hypothetical protein